MNNNHSSGFTLIEVLVALAILRFALSAALKIFSSNALAVSLLEQRTMASFVAENILVQTFSFEDELNYATGIEFQGGFEYQWERLGRAVPPPVLYFISKKLQKDILDENTK